MLQVDCPAEQGNKARKKNNEIQEQELQPRTAPGGNIAVLTVGHLNGESVVLTEAGTLRF